MAVPVDSRLKTFEHHVEDMRSLTLCKICLKPYYEPFILACGHTYCYGCLNSWFGGVNDRRKRKNCPDCRADVVAQPAPNYLLRDLVHMFITRPELLPEDETVEEHNRGKQDEAARVTKDRSGPGLFGGIFEAFGGRHFGRAIIDNEDHVLRCPNCAYELEDGACEQCGWGTPEHAYFSDFTEDDLSGLDDDSVISVPGGLGRPSTGGPHRFYGIGIDGEDTGSDLEDYSPRRANSEELDYYDEEDDFIDNGDYPEELDEEVDLDDDDDVTAFSDISTAPSTVRGPGRFTDTVRSGIPPRISNSRPSGLRRIHHASNPGTDEEWTDYDETDGGEASENNAPTPVRRGRNAILISDDEEDNSTNGIYEEEDAVDSTANTTSVMDSNDEVSNEERDSEPEVDSEESDDTILPAQSRSRRQQRLNNHRNRRTLAYSSQSAAPVPTRRSFSTQQNNGRTMPSTRETRRARVVGYAY